MATQGLCKLSHDCELYLLNNEMSNLDDLISSYNEKHGEALEELLKQSIAIGIFNPELALKICTLVGYALGQLDCHEYGLTDSLIPLLDKRSQN